MSLRLCPVSLINSREWGFMRTLSPTARLGALCPLSNWYACRSALCFIASLAASWWLDSYMSSPNQRYACQQKRSCRLSGQKSHWVCRTIHHQTRTPPHIGPIQSRRICTSRTQRPRNSPQKQPSQISWQMGRPIQDCQKIYIRLLSAFGIGWLYFERISTHQTP